MHRDQTDRTRRKVQKLKFDHEGADVDSTAELDSTDTPGHQKLISLAKSRSKFDLRVKSAVGSVYFNIPIQQDFETVATDVFLSVYSGFRVSSRASGGYMQHAFAMLSRASTDSPLPKAFAAVATTFALILNRSYVDPRIPVRCHTSAAKSLRQAIDDPLRSQDDDLLMAALVLDFCDSITAHFRKFDGMTHQRNHQRGALALIRHRGVGNYKNEASKAMLLSTQASLIQSALQSGTAMPAGHAEWHRPQLLPKNILIDLHAITPRLVDALAKIKQCKETFNDSWHSLDTVLELTDIQNAFTDWYDNLPSDCLPQYLPTQDIPHQIQAAGVYRGMCSVYTDLQVANTLNSWRFQNIMLLQELREIKLHSLDDLDADFCNAINSLNIQIQDLTDGICASVPFFLGDYDQPMAPLPVGEIKFPLLVTEDGTLPTDPRSHSRHATGAGGWFILMPLAKICAMADTNINECPIMLRADQVDWMKGQLRRIQ